MKQSSYIIVLLVITIAMINFVSAEDVNDTHDAIEKTDDNHNAQIQKEITKNQKVDNDLTENKESKELDDSEYEGCCSTIIQGYNNDSVISFRRDSTNKVTINVKQNSSFIKQYKTGSYFFHVIINKDGWLVGNGGADNDYVNTNIESNALTMINNNHISNTNMNNIYNLESKLSVGHFVIKAPNGTYSLIIKNTKTYRESGVLKPGQYLVVPNSPTYYNKGSFTNVLDEKSMITSSRLLAARDKYGVNRREIVTYYYKNNNYNSTVKVSITNDDGKYVSRRTASLIDNVQTNNKYYSSSSIPIIDKSMDIDHVTFFIKNQTTLIPTKFIINKVNNTKYADNVIISGRYVDNKGTNLTYTPLKLVINSKEYTIKTDGHGIFNYAYKANTLGQNNISISYPGNRHFMGAQQKITFNVTRRTSKMIINPISNTQFTDKVIISGRYIDTNGTNLTYTPLKMLINSKELTVKTDKYGIFNYTYTTDQIGSNNVVICYEGNSKYEGASQSASFNVVTKQTKIIINNIYKNGNKVKITGKYMDISGRNLTFTPLKINIDGTEITVKTNGYGEFEYQYQPTASYNKLTISYQGNKRYAGTSQSIAFTVNEKNVTYSMSTIMTIDVIKDINYSENVIITGKYIAADGTNLTYTPIRLTINDKVYDTKTDARGIFTFNIKIDKIGLYTITTSYWGNLRFSGTTASTTFQVK